MENTLITDVPRSFIEEFEDHIKGTLPIEKAQMELKQQSWARIMAASGSLAVEGLGQCVARIEPRMFFRLLHQHGHAPVHEWIEDYLADDPTIRAKGYKPKQNGARHGLTFSNGECISKTPGKVQR